MIAGLEILNLHAQGGMAEVYRARGKGADGRTWQYAVKRILPELTSNNELRSMFIEEARVASMLVHPNIVRVYDLAKSEVDELYIVMEFLEGRDLAEIIDRAIDLGRTLPVWMAIHVAREVLRALVYATMEARDREGRALALIHRDISPHNIFVTFDGQVKLTDFGVAKVAQSSVLTQVGVTKGKFGYMSPEQLMSEKLDFRSDLYNVGILLYEAITGRRLFFGDNASQFLQAMLKAEVPPLDPALRVPRELEHLMRLALTKDRNQRPPNASVFEAELRTIAERYRLVATHEHVANELRAIFGSEIESCAIGDAQQVAPKKLASVSAALPEVVQRAEVSSQPLPAVPQAPQVQPAVVQPQKRPSQVQQAPVQAQQRASQTQPSGGAAQPSGGVAQQQSASAPRMAMPQLAVPQDHVRSLSDPSLQVDLDHVTSPEPMAPASRPATRKKQATLTRTNAKTVRPLLDDEPATVPPDVSGDPSTLPPDAKPPPKRRTVIVGGAGAKAIGLLSDDDEGWTDRTASEQEVNAMRGGIVGRSKRVVPLAPKKK